MTRAYGARVDYDRQRGRIIHDLQATEIDTSGSSPQQARDLEAGGNHQGAIAAATRVTRPAASLRAIHWDV